MATAGRILIIPRGEYDANTTYEMLDLLSYGGTSWIAKQTVAGIEPSDANGEYWQKVFSLQRVESSIVSDYSSNNIMLSKSGDVVSMGINSLKNLTKDKYLLIGTIPKEFRPKGVRTFLLQSPNGDIVRLAVSNNGDLSAYLYTDGSGIYNINELITYVI
jgi:hypothetical protein